MDWRVVTIIGMALATYFTRVTPFFLKIREYRFLKYVPASVFSALVFPDIFKSTDNLIAGIFVFAIAYKNKDLLLAFLTGILTLYILKFVI